MTGDRSRPPELVDRVRQRFVDRALPATSATVVSAVREQPDAAALGDGDLLQLADQVHADLVGAGPLAPLLADSQVTDVLMRKPGRASAQVRAASRINAR